MDTSQLTTTQRAQLLRRAEQTGGAEQLKNTFQQDLQGRAPQEATPVLEQPTQQPQQPTQPVAPVLEQPQAPQQTTQPAQQPVQPQQQPTQQPQPAPQVQTAQPTQPQPAQQPQPITNIAEFKQRGANLPNLQQFIQDRHGVPADIVGNTVQAVIDGEKFEWKIDASQNPARTSLGRTDVSQEEMFARETGIPFVKIQGAIQFSPQDLNQAIDLFQRFGNSVNVSKHSLKSLQGQAILSRFSKYKGATVDELYSGLTTGEIAIGGEAWNLITRLNNGETPAMIEARERYEKSLQLSNINANNKVLNDVFSGISPEMGTILSTFNERISQMDNQFLENTQDFFVNKREAFTQFQEGNEVIRDLKDNLTEVGNRIDELNTEKVNLLEDLRERHPTASLSRLLTLASKETRNIDKQIFVEQREYSRLQSDYEFEREQANIEFKFNMEMIDQEMEIFSQMYNLSRSDMKEMQGLSISMQIRKEDIERQDMLLEQQRVEKEMQYQRAIERADYEFARGVATQMEMIKYQADINQQMQGFQFLTPTSGVIAKVNPATGDMEIVFDERGWDGGILPANIAAQLGLSEGATTADWASQFRITQNYGAKDTPNQDDVVLLANGQRGTPGLDLAMPVGTDVISFTGGEVVKAWSTPGYGTQVIVKDDNGNEHMYSHLSKPVVLPGGRVEAGQVIAKSGNTGISTGPHLDYRVKSSDGQWIDPNQFAFPGTTSPEANILSEATGAEFTPQKIQIFKDYQRLGNIDETEMAKRLGVSRTDAIKQYNAWFDFNEKTVELSPAELQFFSIATAELPVKIRDSVEQSAQLKTLAKDMMRRGIDALTAADIFQGFDVDMMKQENYELLLGGQGLTTSLRGLSYQLPEEKFDQARFARTAIRETPASMVQQVEQAYFSQYPELAETHEKAELFVSQAERLRELFNTYDDYQRTGIWTRPMVLGRVINNPEEGLDMIRSQVSILRAGAMQGSDSLGTQWTEAQLEEMGEMLVNKDMPVATNITRLNNLEANTLFQVNAARNQRALPSMQDKDQLLNWDDRVNLYLPGGQPSGATGGNTPSSSTLQEFRRRNNYNINF